MRTHQSRQALGAPGAGHDHAAGARHVHDRTGGARDDQPGLAGDDHGIDVRTDLALASQIGITLSSLILGAYAQATVAVAIAPWAFRSLA